MLPRPVTERNPLAGQTMARVNEAADTLLDPDQRHALDAELAREGTPAAKRTTIKRRDAERKPSKLTATKPQTSTGATSRPLRRPKARRSELVRMMTLMGLWSRC
jgi:hypothetical protein